MNGLLDLIQTNRTLGYGTMLFIVLSIGIALLIPFENRQVLGINLWLKPLKFAVSIAIFLLTSLYLIDLLPISEGRKSLYSWVLLITMLIEILAIVLQAARGQLSHFNISDPLGSVLFPLMGIAIFIAYIIYAVLLYDFFTQPLKITPELLWAIRLGIIIFLFGALTGFQMAGSLKHSIGIEDGGPGIPFTNWSTVAGDLRVAHFFSIHAIQVLPLLALVLLRFTSVESITNLRIVWGVGILYFLFNALTYFQALNGKPFIRI